MDSIPQFGDDQESILSKAYLQLHRSRDFHHILAYTHQRVSFSHSRLPRADKLPLVNLATARSPITQSLHLYYNFSSCHTNTSNFSNKNHTWLLIVRVVNSPSIPRPLWFPARSLLSKIPFGIRYIRRLSCTPQYRVPTSPYPILRRLTRYTITVQKERRFGPTRAHQ